MRKLNMSQKNLLTHYFNCNKDKIGFFFKAEDLEVYDECYDLNPFEDFNSAVERFISDLSEVK